VVTSPAGAFQPAKLAPEDRVGSELGVPWRSRGWHAVERAGFVENQTGIGIAAVGAAREAAQHALDPGAAPPRRRRQPEHRAVVISPAKVGRAVERAGFVEN
jgi:hypothetical protein